MDGVSGAFAVISLPLQLAETGEKISAFITGVQDAPSEVIRLGQVLDQLSGTLKQVNHLLEQQYLVLRLPGSPVFITNALENCEKRIKALEKVTQKAKMKMDRQSQARRSWPAMRFVLKKDDIREMQSQLRDAEAGLQTAILSNSWQLQMHSISAIGSGFSQARKSEEASSVGLANSVSRCEKVQSPSSTQKEVSRTTARETSTVWYDGVFGSVNVQRKSKSLHRSNTTRLGDRVISEEKIVRIRTAYLHKTIELRFLNSFGQISRTLSICPVLDYDAPIFKLCMNGDLQGLKVALSSGTISPFVLNRKNWSLLHYAAFFNDLEMIAFLLQIGIDENREDALGRTAFYIVTSRIKANSTHRHTVDILRLLTQSQNETSPRCISRFWSHYNGPVQGAEFMFSQDLIPLESDDLDGRDSFPLLATALRGYGAQGPEWEGFLQLLLRKRVGLHSQVPRDLENITEFDPTYPCEISKYGTPLDELFARTETPFRGEVAADRWLQILSSEGYDVVAYLEEESALHAQQMQFSFPSQSYSWYSIPRQLIYRWGGNPSVSWDWWIDPNSSTYLVREEFKFMTCPSHGSYLRPWREWEFYWPWCYPAWFTDPVFLHEYRVSRQQLYDRAQERANRRLKKKALKAARAQGFKNQDRMPGAWPV